MLLVSIPGTLLLGSTKCLASFMWRRKLIKSDILDVSPDEMMEVIELKASRADSPIRSIYCCGYVNTASSVIRLYTN